MLYFFLIWPKHVFPVCSIFLQVILSIVESGLMFFFSQSIPVQSLCAIVFFATTIPSIHSCLGRCSGIIWHFSQRVFEIFCSLPLPGSLCTVWLSLSFLVILLTPNLDTWKPSDNFLCPLPLNQFPFCWHDAFTATAKNPYWSFYTVYK